MICELVEPLRAESGARLIENARLALAENAGVDPIDLYIDRLIASEGRELFAHWNRVDQFENQFRYLKHPQCIPMLCDAGAHVSVIMDTDTPTFLSTELTRKRGIYSLADVIHRIPLQSAEVIGLKERGGVREGWHAADESRSNNLPANLNL